MTNKLNDEEVALMCDIAQNSAITITAQKTHELERLVADDFISREPRKQGRDGIRVDAYVLTDKGQRALAELGVGANES